MKISIIIPCYNVEEWITKCLDSIELREDIEIILINDSSTDNTNNLIKEWIDVKQFENIKYISNEINIGEGLTLNKGFDRAVGEYVLIVDSDDWLMKKTSVMISELTGEDMIYYDLETNNGTIFKVTQETKMMYCGATKLYKRSFLGETRRNDKRIHGDGELYYKLLEKNPTEKFTSIIFYHYNFPRIGSLTDRFMNSEAMKK